MTEIVTRATNTVTIAEAARQLGMSLSTARRAEKAGTFPLPILRTKSWVRVLRKDLDAYLGSPPQPHPISNPTADPARVLLLARRAACVAELAIIDAALNEPTPLIPTSSRNPRKETPIGKRTAA